MKITFIGATETVTGSKTLLEFHGLKILIDCGLYQGARNFRELNWTELYVAPEVDFVLLTHAHIDHSGYLPRLRHCGFKGTVISTEATHELCKILLKDAAKLQLEDAHFANKTKYSHHSPAEPLFTEEDVEDVLDRFRTYKLHNWINLKEGISFRFFRTGHILGSVGIQIKFIENEIPKIITFTGDLGSGRSQVIKDPENINETDYLVCESTYGGRKIKPLNEDEFADVINRVYKRSGTLIIPAFSVGRTQEILFIIRKLQNNNKISLNIPIYLDSPMSQKASEIYLDFKEELKLEVSKNQPNTFFIPTNFRISETSDESMLLCMSDQPKIVISASGMLQGGRVMHHLKSKLPFSKNAVLFTGYQGQGTKGRVLKDGISQIRIHKQLIDVEAEIIVLDALSAHADTDELMKWMRFISKNPKQTFLIHGEPDAQNALAYRIKTELEREVIIPKSGDSFII